ncbi:hypothetical protein CYLTODRAFT_445979 [Cylindrobasidium torrendii FP15055 ss-10]|uniref:Uncharacterized protein n=1 Tax=Cylindrobasidium torrendii FP15055 ss-10 TaxID=1314674 RepID=A0A0D7B1V5_9AGAR|nr:hypothetical protein CYLTODRAFT_445979 [Cylindrobasidium torrendii FP15055 ss-10]
MSSPKARKSPLPQTVTIAADSHSSNAQPIPTDNTTAATTITPPTTRLAPAFSPSESSDVRQISTLPFTFGFRQNGYTPFLPSPFSATSSMSILPNGSSGLVTPPAYLAAFQQGYNPQLMQQVLDQSQNGAHQNGYNGQTPSGTVFTSNGLSFDAHDPNVLAFAHFLQTQNQFRNPQHYREDTSYLNDLERLENLKNIIKNGQHPLFNPAPKPRELEALWNGPHSKSLAATAMASPPSPPITIKALPASLPPKPATFESPDRPRETPAAKETVTPQPVRHVPARYDRETPSDGRPAEDRQFIPRASVTTANDRQHEPSSTVDTRRDDKDRRGLSIDDRDRNALVPTLSSAPPLRENEDRHVHSPDDRRISTEHRSPVSDPSKTSIAPVPTAVPAAVSADAKIPTSSPTSSDASHKPVLPPAPAPALASRTADASPARLSLRDRIRSPPAPQSSSVPLEHRMSVKTESPVQPVKVVYNRPSDVVSTRSSSASPRRPIPPPGANSYRPSEYRSTSDYRPPVAPPAPENSYRPVEENYRPSENTYRPTDSSFRPSDNTYRPLESGASYRPGDPPRENNYRPDPPRENNYRPSEVARENNYRPTERSASYRLPSPPPPPPGSNSYRPGAVENNYRPLETPRERDYDRFSPPTPADIARDRDRLVSRHSTAALPPVDVYDRGRDRERLVWEDERYRRERERDLAYDRRTPAYLPPPAPLSPSPYYAGGTRRPRSPSPVIANKRSRDEWSPYGGGYASEWAERERDRYSRGYSSR